MCTGCVIKNALMKEKILKLHLDHKMPIKEICKLYNYHRNTISGWKSDYIKYGIEGLIDKSRKPNSHADEFSKETINAIKTVRKDPSNRRIIGPIEIRHRLIKQYGINASRSGIAKVLKRENLIDLKKSKRNKKKNRLKMQKITTPGELIQGDVKYAFKHISGYWNYQYSAVDYFTGLAYGIIYEIQSNLETVLFTKSISKYYPFDIQGIQTDNHAVFTNRYTGYLKSADVSNPRLHSLDLLCQRLNIEHYLIDKGKPAQNGKVERFHRACEEEFYQRESFKTLDQARRKFRDFIYYYNHERSHQGLDGLTPIEKLRTIPEFSHIKELIPK